MTSGSICFFCFSLNYKLYLLFLLSCVKFENYGTDVVYHNILLFNNCKPTCSGLFTQQMCNTRILRHKNFLLLWCVELSFTPVPVHLYKIYNFFVFHDVPDTVGTSNEKAVSICIVWG
jgi:hypothetical protein